MNRSYTHEQRQRACEMEILCRESFESKGITLIPTGNCVECYCSDSCDDCHSDSYCDPDYAISGLDISIEVTGYNPRDKEQKPGMRITWDLVLTECKIRNFIENFLSGNITTEYVWHYANITGFDSSTGRPFVVLRDHIRIIKLDESFVDAYNAEVFRTFSTEQDDFICIPPNSQYVISETEMYESISYQNLSKNISIS